MLMRRLLLCLMLITPAAWAEHEEDHRYEVTGLVLDADGRAPAATPVSIDSDGQMLGFGYTGEDGRYTLNLHLHDPDLGRKLRLRAGDHEAVIEVRFTPGDSHTKRIHHANFIGGQFDELERQPANGWLWAAGGGGALLIALAGVVLWRRRSR